MDSIWAVSVTHKNTPLHKIGMLIGERNVLTNDLATHLETIKNKLSANGLFYLATCNRLLLVVSGAMPLDMVHLPFLFKQFNEQLSEEDIRYFAQNALVFKGQEASQHLFEVAASVDSLVVGEREILRQIRESFDFCRQHQLLNDKLRLLLDHAVTVAKEVYTHTRIGENSLSVVSLAIEKMLQHHPKRDARILLVGAGKTMLTAGKLLRKKGYQNFVIFNRTIANAKPLARTLQAEVLPLQNLTAYTKNFDVLISCVGGVAQLLNENQTQDLLQHASINPIIIDLAVPNNLVIPPNTSAKYIDVEKLRLKANENHQKRKSEVTRAHEIIVKHTQIFSQNIKRRKIERAMTEIPRQLKGIRTRAFESVFEKDLAAMDAQGRETLEKVVSYLEKKYTSIPIVITRQVLENEIE
ncbi:MAG: hypothetical protein R2798_12115 [Chitinophagales bacterium]|nr:hypothetical protein [Bacteroidota bacterium]MCB9043650.1 hypothetical protein [Chitinophagales bacterium]